MDDVRLDQLLERAERRTLPIVLCNIEPDASVNQQTQLARIKLFAHLHHI
ncbi:hypothetical protein SPH9361_04040 [Sphingobium sp. CECT 9361]|nr:hypothetical protein SPH9361_04040 [Sphingobium sp. CECT 9361]